MGNLLKKLLVKGLPLSSAGLFTISSEFVIVTLLSKKGEVDLAAYAFILGASELCINPAIGLISQLPVYVAENYAQKKAETDDLVRLEKCQEIENTVKSTWYFGMALSVIPITLLANMESISKAFVSDPAVRKGIGEYFLPYVFSIPLQIFNSANLFLLSAVDQEKHIYWLSIVQIFSEISLAFLLIPEYGVSGSGYIKLGSSLLVASGCLATVYFSKSLQDYSLLKFRPKSGFGYTKKYINRLARQGFPISIYMLSLTCTNFISLIFMEKISNRQLAIYQAILQFLNPLYVACRGISASGNRYVAQSLGQYDYCTIKKYSILTLAVAAGFLTIGYGVGLAVAPDFIKLFVDINHGNDVSDSVIRLTFLAFALSKIANLLEDTCGQLLAGIEDTYLLALVNITLMFSIILPTQAIATSVLGWSIYGIAAGSACGYLISSIVLINFLMKQLREAIATNHYAAKTESSNAKITNFFCKKGDGARTYATVSDDESTSLQADSRP